MDETNGVYRVETETGYLTFRGEFAHESAMDYVEAHGGRVEVCDSDDEAGSWTFLDDKPDSMNGYWPDAE
jgi:hypothetical protein